MLTLGISIFVYVCFQGGTQVSKLDKADILEMTVSHLRQIHHQQLTAAFAASSGAVHNFRDGFTECAAETVRYMEASRAYPAEMIARMRCNLATKVAYSMGSSQVTPRLAITSSTRADLSSMVSDRASDYSGLQAEAHRTPVKVKVESLSSPCKTISSPDSGFDSTFSPLLMPVPYHSVKQETDSAPLSPGEISSPNTSGHSSGISGLSPSTSMCKTSQSSVLALPPRVLVPVSVVGDSPSQKQVWRPF